MEQVLIIMSFCIFALSIYVILQDRRINKLEERTNEVEIEVNLRTRLTEQQKKQLVEELAHIDRVGTWRK